MSVWFVTGASRGLGAEIVRAALARGHRVAATARDADTVRTAFPGAGDRLLAVAADVTDHAQVQAAADAAAARFGSIDVLVNNAGHGLLGAVEEVTDTAARALFDVNFFGVLAVQRAVLPHLRARRAGRVFNISSVGGFAGAAGWGLYAASKFALEGMSESLREELAPLGIAVTIVEPGGFRTDFLDASSLYVEPGELKDYAPSAGQTRTVPGLYNHEQAGDPAKLAEVLVDVAEAEDPPLRLQLGRDCVERVIEKLDQVRRDLDTWRSLAESTDHADANAA